ncbi:hypothetical protein CK489_12475 [Bradyrhizobium sp. UFLA03-84]|uniref:hypothetical protein n=1 Tax=Bradyrhizobium sp. UFLA03-84 TaxID=418599 RepID=UPI000BADFB6B|nr:hypothetical protein [Bradyrhizobium sp. UFLA03-84]PAY08533.1 hypothetical protein CK489_12475 [Bradyrhizobium sp. UFLA03-84]
MSEKDKDCNFFVILIGNPRSIIQGRARACITVLQARQADFWTSGNEHSELRRERVQLASILANFDPRQPGLTRFAERDKSCPCV